MKYNIKKTSTNRILYLNESEDFIDEDDSLEFDDDLNEDVDYLNEADDENSNEPEPPMDEEKLRIESVKLATNIAKLMSNVMPEDIINLAGHVAAFIRNNNQDLSASPTEFGESDTQEFDDMTEPEGDETNNEE